MKKLTTIIGAILLVLCFTQCRKEVKTVTPEEAKGYPITLTMDETSKVDVNVVEGEHFGEVTFGAGDKIYVANQGRFVGTITHDGSKFEGTIYDPTPDDPIEGYLYFYFLGNKTPSENVSKPEDIANYETYHPTTLTVSISDQSGSQMPLLSCGKSNKVFSGGGSDYSAILGNKCALVKFNITKSSGASGKNLLLAGLNNEVEFDLTKVSVYTDANVSYSQKDGGCINVGNRTGNIWLILLPQDDDKGGMVYSSDLTYYGTRGSLTGVVANHAIKDAVKVSLNTALPTSYPTGTMHGLFSVANNRKVFFSQGNLQYIGSAGSPYWKFAENQYDYLGTEFGQNSAREDVDRDLFGWGTSGWLEHGNYFYQPYCTSNSQTNPYLPSNGYGYGPMKKSEDNANVSIIDAYADGDWGVYNRTKITYGGDVAYRTMTGAEWKWLLGPKESPIPGDNCRRSSYVNGISNARFTYAIINTDGTPVKGLIIFPDLYLAGTPPEVTWGIINSNSNYTTRCTLTGWDNLEKAGCVFLPAAGRRDGTTINYANDSDARGLYWASTRKEAQTAFHLEFGKTVFDSQNSHKRFFGYSVRLVTDF